MSDTVETIEVGKTYEITAYRKKSLVEVEMFEHSDTGKRLNTEVLWRNGTFLVTPQNEDEAQFLQESLGEDGEVWDYEDYDIIELWDTFDGCAEDFVFFGNHFTEEEQDKLNEDYEAQLESENWQGRYEFLTERGYDSDGCNWTIHGGIEARIKEAS